MISLRDSPIYRQKSKDASGHEHSSETGQFTSGGGGTAKPSKPESKLRSAGKPKRKPASELTKEGKKDRADSHIGAASYYGWHAADNLEKLAKEFPRFAEKIQEAAKHIREERYAQGKVIIDHISDKLLQSEREYPATVLRAGYNADMALAHAQRAAKLQKASYREQSATSSGKPANNLPKSSGAAEQKSVCPIRKGDSGRWVTLEPSGTHVHFGEGGDHIDKGPEKLVNKPANNLPKSPEKTTDALDNPSPAGDNTSGGAGTSPGQKPEGGKMELPKLSGSEKQVTWATELRNKKAADLQTLAAVHPDAEVRKAASEVLAKDDSRYWIDHRETALDMQLAGGDDKLDTFTDAMDELPKMKMQAAIAGKVKMNRDQFDQAAKRLPDPAIEQMVRDAGGTPSAKMHHLRKWDNVAALGKIAGVEGY